MNNVMARSLTYIRSEMSILYHPLNLNEHLKAPCIAHHSCIEFFYLHELTCVLSHIFYDGWHFSYFIFSPMHLESFFIITLVECISFIFFICVYFISSCLDFSVSAEKFDRL